MGGIRFPGVYVEEVPFGIPSMEAVATSTAAFVGAVSSGPIWTSVRVRDWTEYERAFGGLDPGFHLGSAVRQFFANGGSEAWVAAVPPGGAAGRGLEALDVVPEIGLVCLPGEADPEVLRSAQTWAHRRRAFLIVDAPSGARREAVEMVRALAAVGRSNAALYYPWIRVEDPTGEGAVRECPPSGSVAGVYARTDRNRGVWKAPAGAEAVLSGTVQPAVALDDAETAVLTEAGVNCIRTVAGRGTAVWGARTVQGTAEAASEWKYVPVRRVALFVEETLYRGTTWVVFEPNDEPLWEKLRGVVEQFLDGLWRAGAFQGEAAEDAYFVRTGTETMTQNDIDNGRVNVVVGFAPLKPAEFVEVRIQLLSRRVDAEVVGEATGEPGWRVALPHRAARAKHLSVQVEESAGWVTWTLVESLLTARPADRVYAVERGAGHGAVTFGDGHHGAVPPAGARIRASYLSGAGREGSKPRGGRRPRPTGESCKAT